MRRAKKGMNRPKLEKAYGLRHLAWVGMWARRGQQDFRGIDKLIIRPWKSWARNVLASHGDLYIHGSTVGKVG